MAKDNFTWLDFQAWSITGISYLLVIAGVFWLVIASYSPSEADHADGWWLIYLGLILRCVVGTWSSQFQKVDWFKNPSEGA